VVILWITDPLEKLMDAVNLLSLKEIKEEFMQKYTA
jgi:hypothetical protein